MRGGNGYRDRDNRGGGRDSRDRGKIRDWECIQYELQLVI